MLLNFPFLALLLLGEVLERLDLLELKLLLLRTSKNLEARRPLKPPVKFDLKAKITSFRTEMLSISGLMFRLIQLEGNICE